VKEHPIARLRPFPLLVFGLLVLALLALPLPAFSQSCALCYTQAASAGARMIQALKSGILILIIPPTLGSVGMIFVMRHKHHQTRRAREVGEWKQDW
jgi:energy-coupling factor transporter transmembrane protein EcfT